jgi:hypothetical protein
VNQASQVTLGVIGSDGHALSASPLAIEYARPSGGIAVTGFRTNTKKRDALKDHFL